MLVLLVGVIFLDKVSSVPMFCAWFWDVLWFVLTFPAGLVGFWFLNPVIWGIFGFVIHAAIESRNREEKRNNESNPS